MEIAIKLPGMKAWVMEGVSSLAIARLVAEQYEFYDVDIEPMEPGRVRLTATGENRTIRFNGTSIRGVSEKLIASLMEENNK